MKSKSGVHLSLLYQVYGEALLPLDALTSSEADINEALSCTCPLHDAGPLVDQGLA